MFSDITFRDFVRRSGLSWMIDGKIVECWCCPAECCIARFFVHVQSSVKHRLSKLMIEKRGCFYLDINWCLIVHASARARAYEALGCAIRSVGFCWSSWCGYLLSLCVQLCFQSLFHMTHFSSVALYDVMCLLNFSRNPKIVIHNNEKCHGSRTSRYREGRTVGHGSEHMLDVQTHYCMPNLGKLRFVWTDMLVLWIPGTFSHRLLLTHSVFLR